MDWIFLIKTAFSFILIFCGTWYLRRDEKERPATLFITLNRRMLGAEYPTAHTIQCLLLLPSGPDKVHSGKSHGTQSSSRKRLQKYTTFFDKKQYVKQFFGKNPWKFVFPAIKPNLSPKQAQCSALCLYDDPSYFAETAFLRASTASTRSQGRSTSLRPK